MNRSPGLIDSLARYLIVDNRNLFELLLVVADENFHALDFEVVANVPITTLIGHHGNLANVMFFAQISGDSNIAVILDALCTCTLVLAIGKH